MGESVEAVYVAWTRIDWVLYTWLEHVDGCDDLAEFIHYQKLPKLELAVGT